MKICRVFILFLTCLLFFNSCKLKKTNSAFDINDPNILHENEDQLTQVIIYDVFTPPVATRIYAYSSLASYEAVHFMKPGSNSITQQLNGFPVMPQPDPGKKYNFILAATKAFFTVVHKVVFSVDSLKAYEQAVYDNFENSLDEETFQRSV